jgi:hypothetical protein
MTVMSQYCRVSAGQTFARAKAIFLQRQGKLLFLRAQYRAILAPALRSWAWLARDG